jgi:hypothetical protein
MDKVLTVEYVPPEPTVRAPDGGDVRATTELTRAPNVMQKRMMGEFRREGSNEQCLLQRRQQQELETPLKRS